MFFSKYLKMRGNYSARIGKRMRNRAKLNSHGLMVEFLEPRTLLTTTYNLSILSDANGAFDGSPVTGFIIDSHGNLFGSDGGSVFELTKNGAGYIRNVLSVLSGTPNGPLVMDSSGDLFGTTTSDNDVNGTVFELVKNGASYTLNMLVQFNGSDGANPYGGLVMDSSGDLFGDTSGGGLAACGFNPFLATGV
jgi:hypothetical protein